MKHFTAILFTLLVLYSAAQRPFSLSTTIPGNTNLNERQKTFQTTKDDGLEILLPGNWSDGHDFVIYTTENGYVAGTNEYGDLAKGQVFEIDQPLYLHGVYYWVGALDNRGGQVEFTIRQFDSQPGAIIAFRNVIMATVDSVNIEEEYVYVTFDPPVRIDNDFFLGIELSAMGSSSIGLVSTSDGQGTGRNLVWEQWSDQSWYSFMDTDSWQLDIDLGIFPVIEWAETGPDPDPDPDEGISNIRVAQRTDGSGLVDVTCDFAAEAGQYLVDLELSLDGGASFNLVNPSLVTGNWPVTPGSNRQLLLNAGQAAPDASTNQARIRLTPRSGLLVTTAPASGITSEMASITGEVLSDGGHAVTSRGVAYGTAPNPLSTGTSVPSGSGTGSFTAEIAALMPNTTYYARAWATNSQGTAYGNQVSFQTLPEGPMVIHGPDGATITIPEAAKQQASRVTLTEHPPLNRQHEQAASVAFRVQMDGNQQIVHAKDDFLITLPVTLKNPNPDNLYFIVQMENGGLAPIPGTYNHEKGTYQIKTFGMAKDYVFQVVSGPPPTVVTSASKSWPETEQTTGEKTWDWPSLDFVIYDYSAADPRPLSEQAITDHILPVARDVLSTLKNSRFAAPLLQQDSMGRYHMILADTLKYSYYEPPFNQLLGRIFIDYPDYMADINDPSTWWLEYVIMHEAFHAVQWRYDFKMHADTSYWFEDWMNTSSAYLEGTAELAGATYQLTGSLTSGRVHVQWGRDPHDLGHPVDDFIYSSAYEKQDFFVFIAKRFFNSNLIHLDPLWLALGSEISVPSKRKPETSDYLLQFRKDFDYFLRSAGTSLPEAYTEYALQRLFFHEEEFLLRDAERNGDVDGFTPNTLSRNLLERSKKHFEWQPMRPDTLAYAPLSITDIRPLSSAAATFYLPDGLESQYIPDTLFFMVDISGGGQLNQLIREEGIRLTIIRARNEHGQPVAEDAAIVVDDISQPVKVPMDEDVTHLVFLVANAYVEEVITGITVTLNDELEFPDFRRLHIVFEGQHAWEIFGDYFGYPHNPNYLSFWGGGTYLAGFDQTDIFHVWDGDHFSIDFTHFDAFMGSTFSLKVDGRFSPDRETLMNVSAEFSDHWGGTSIETRISVSNLPFTGVANGGYEYKKEGANVSAHIGEVVYIRRCHFVQCTGDYIQYESTEFDASTIIRAIFFP